MAIGALLADRDRDALDALIAEQEAALLGRTPRSHELHVAASVAPPGRRRLVVAGRPPVPGVHRAGQRFAGLGRRRHRVRRPARRLRHDARRPRPPGDRRRRHRRVAAGTHFAQPVPDIVPVAAELARRFGLPMWRFTNSGTEATMAAST